MARWSPRARLQCSPLKKKAQPRRSAPKTSLPSCSTQPSTRFRHALRSRPSRWSRRTPAIPADAAGVAGAAAGAAAAPTVMAATAEAMVAATAEAMVAAMAPPAGTAAAPAGSSLAKYYLTCAIDYANGDPHLGHAFEKIGADAIARYRRLLGDDVHFLVGMDEHGQKVALEAADRGTDPQALVAEMAEGFQRMWARLGISYDQFIRTTEESHREGVRALIEAIFQNSPEDFYEKEYEGWYCVGCEAFKQTNEIIQGKCVLHPTRTLQWVSEKNWFFRLSAYAGRLRELISGTDFLGPRTRRNEMLALIDQGLDDISASRARFSWGVPFPRPSSDGETQTTYVWFDALPNYLTATGYPAKGFTARDIRLPSGNSEVHRTRRTSFA